MSAPDLLAEPPFLVLPEIVGWGLRLFRIEGSTAQRTNESPVTYVEAFTYWIPTVATQEGDPTRD